MSYSIFDTVKKGVNIFLNKDPTDSKNVQKGNLFSGFGTSSYDRPDRMQWNYGNDRTIVTPIINRIALDCCNKKIREVIIDPSNNDRVLKFVDDSGLNQCLNLEANLDQTGRALIQDIVMSMLDEGVVAVVPVEVDKDPGEYNGNDIKQFTTYDILKLRTGKIMNWYADHVDVKVYNEATATRQVISISKSKCAIIENPLYAVMNAHNSFAKRLMRQLQLMDIINEKAGSDKLNMVVKLPYAVKNDIRKAMAEERRQEIEDQLSKSKLGIAYMGNEEQIQTIGGSIENQVVKSIEYLTSMLYGQLGMPKEVFEGNANDIQMNLYMNTTIKPIMNAIVDEFNRKFLTKTARTKGHRIKYYISMFEYVSVSNLADIADKLNRNAIVTPNEFRGVLGLEAYNSPLADELSNKNMPAQMQDINGDGVIDEQDQYYDENSQNEGENYEVEGG